MEQERPMPPAGEPLEEEVPSESQPEPSAPQDQERPMPPAGEPLEDEVQSQPLPQPEPSAPQDQEVSVVAEPPPNSSELLFVHIPKNAGSSIEEAALAGGVGWAHFDQRLTGNMTMPDGNSCNMWHVPPRFAKELYNMSKRVVCVKRHPYLRVLSEYTYLLSVDWGVNDSQHYNDHLSDHEPCSSQSVNEFVQAAMKNYQHGQRYQHDCHFVPQVEYIWDENNKRICSDIVSVDDMPFAFNSVLTKAGMQFQIPTESYNGHQGRCPGLSMHHLWHSTRRMVRRVYKDDFERLGYRTDRVH